jgi:hypothetical protein
VWDAVLTAFVDQLEGILKRQGEFREELRRREETLEETRRGLSTAQVPAGSMLLRRASPCMHRV